MSEETKLKLSNSRKLRKEKFPELEERSKKNLREYWNNNIDKIPEILKKISDANTKYKIYQYTKDMKLIKVWNCVMDIIKENPNYKKHNIYAVCSGEKPTMYGYIWDKVLKDDIVQTELKDSEK